MEIAFDVSYWFLWIAFIVRTAITSYMNVKFSRELEQTNRQFQYVFNESAQNVKSVYEQSQEEQVARARAQRFSKFCREYAD